MTEFKPMTAGEADGLRLHGHSSVEWYELKCALAKRNLAVTHIDMIGCYLDTGLKHFTQTAKLEDLDERISSAVARGVADANTEALNENLQLRAEVERLQKCVDSIRLDLQEFDESGTPF